MDAIQRFLYNGQSAHEGGFKQKPIIEERRYQPQHPYPETTN